MGLIPTRGLRRGSILLALCAATVLVLAAFGAPAQALITYKPNGQVVGVTPRAGVAPASIPGSAAASHSAAAKRFAAAAGLTLDPAPPASGPPLVLHSSAPYLVFWDPANLIPAGSRLLLARYFADVSADSGKASNVYGVLRQYYDGTGFADYTQSFGASQVITDSQPYPPADTTNCSHTSPSFPICITDFQIQNELSRLIGAERLPTGTGPGAPIYFVVTPANVNVCADGADCADNVFCAYHSAFTTGSANVLYASIPTLILGPGQDPKACQFDSNTAVQEPNADPADVVVGYVSHENSETITDPVNGTGWWDPTTGNEVGDVCAATGPTNPTRGANPSAYLPILGGSASTANLFDQQIGGHPYYTQSEWSNGDGSCDMRPPGAALAASFNAPASANAGATLSFDPATSTAASGYSSVTWSFGDGTAPVFTTGTAPVAITHTFPTPGNYSVTLRLVDASGDLSSATHQLIVGSPPSAAFKVSPNPAGARSPVSFNAGDSADPNPGGSIVSYSWHFGDGSVGGGMAPSHAYTSAGSYAVTLTVTDRFGISSAPVTHVVVVEQPPSASLALTTAHPEAGLPVAFSGSRSTAPQGPISSYTWSFGDGGHAGGITVKHTYTKPGTYLVALTVRDSRGVTATSTAVVKVVSRVTAVSVQTKGNRRLLLVKTNGAGMVYYSGHSVRLRGAGTARFVLSLSSSDLRSLSQRHPVSVTLAIKFVPAGGSAEKSRPTLKIKS